MPQAGKQAAHRGGVKLEGRPAVREKLSRPDTIPPSSFPLTNSYAALVAEEPQSANGATVQQLERAECSRGTEQYDSSAGTDRRSRMCRHADRHGRFVLLRPSQLC